MNNTNLNGSSINGSGLPSWVIRTGAVAAAIAVAVSVEPKRTAYASAFGNAAATVTVSQNKIVHGFSTGIGSSSADAEANVTFAGAVNGIAISTGYVAAQRTFQASASGNAGCTGYALAASLLGEATVSCGASIVDANAHRVQYGKSSVTCGATGTSAPDGVTRYGSVLAPASAIIASIDASIKLNGESFYRNDGYCLAYANATGAIDPTKTEVITTLGVFAFGNSSAQANAFIIHPGHSNATTSVTAQPVIATFIFNQAATADAAAYKVDANGVRVVLPTASGNASATANKPKGRMRYAAACIGMAEASSVLALGGKLLHADVGASAIASVVNCAGNTIQYGRVTTASATALTGRAYGITNSEISAPDDRTMFAGSEDRSMIVSGEDRLMMAA